MMPCNECRELETHTFRSSDDLVHALRLAGEEMDRGVLSRVTDRSLEVRDQEALDSILESGTLPVKVHYRFRCEVCGDQFSLAADTNTGEGGWTREEKPPGSGG
jgi:hypothetical protein